MGNQEMVKQATEVMDFLESDSAKGLNLLKEFALNYASDPGLVDESLLLAMELRSADKPQEREDTIKEVKELLDKIIANRSRTPEINESPHSGLNMISLDKLQPEDQTHKLALKIRDLKKSYGTDFSLEEINLDCYLGQITGIVGENANGKTTLLDLIAGLKRRDSGDILFPLFTQPDAKKDWESIKRRIAYVPQNLGTWPGNLIDYLHLSGSMHGLIGEENRKDVLYIIHRLGLVHHMHKNWSVLSGGFKLRFALAAALVWKPQLLLLDEPLANLDINTQLLVLTDIRNLAKSLRYPICVLISSQHLHEVENIADQILFLNAGKMAFIGSREEVGFERSENLFEFSCDLNFRDLEEKLEVIKYNKLHYNGINYILCTPLNVTSNDLFDCFVANNIQVVYFRNISQSIKKFFV